MHKTEFIRRMKTHTTKLSLCKFLLDIKKQFSSDANHNKIGIRFELRNVFEIVSKNNGDHDKVWNDLPNWYKYRVKQLKYEKISDN